MAGLKEKAISYVWNYARIREHHLLHYMYNNAREKFDKSTKIFNKIVAFAKGRMFDDIMLAGRSNGYNVGDLIENPAYIIESLIRHELASEIDLIASSVTLSSGYTKIAFNSTSGYLLSDLDGYYETAYLHNITKDYIALVEFYVGSTKEVYIDGSYYTDTATTDKYKMINIKGDTLIDTTSFDYVGNATNGVRKDWKFAKSINEINTFGDIVKRLCFESFTSIVKSGTKYKLIPVLESRPIVHGILDNPLYSNGMPLINYTYTQLDSIYTDYEINYCYENGRNEYSKTIVVNNNFGTNIGEGSIVVAFAEEQVKIKNAIKNYKVSKKFVYSCDWICDNTTAGYFTRRIIDLYTKQRLIVTYTGDIKNHIQYEVGDVVKINYPKMIPASLNNSAQFQIQGKSIDMTKRNGSVTFSLLEI